jgi:hypothetical protein
VNNSRKREEDMQYTKGDTKFIKNRTLKTSRETRFGRPKGRWELNIKIYLG